MKNIRGGYANLDLKSLDLKTEHTVAGIFDEVKTYVEDVNKPLIIHNMVFNDELQNDTYVTDVKVAANNIKLYCSGLEITITNANKIKAIEVEASGGTTVEANPELVGGEDVLGSLKIGSVNYKVNTVEANVQGTSEDEDLTTIEIDGVTFKIPQGGSSGSDFQTVSLPITYEKLSGLSNTKPVKVLGFNGQFYGYGILNSFETGDDPVVTTYELYILGNENISHYTTNSTTQTVTSTTERYNNAIKANSNVVAHAFLTTTNDFVMAIKDSLDPSTTQFDLSDFSPALNLYLFDLANTPYTRIYLPVELHDENFSSLFVDTQLVELHLHQCTVGSSTSFEAYGIMTTTFNSTPYEYLVKLISDSLPGSYVNVYVYRITKD